jgi:hypothetical protein
MAQGRVHICSFFWTYTAQMNQPGKLDTNKEAHISSRSFDLRDVEWQIGDRVHAK